MDEQALVDAFQEKRIHAAAVNVLTEESPQLIVTPHVAWASQAARQRLVNELVGNITAFLRGEPRNTVN